MAGGSQNSQQRPEGLVHELQHRLWWHRVWDWALMVLPLLFACFYTLYSFHTSGWITAEIAIFTLSGTVGILLALALRVGSEKLPLVEVAQFIDHRVRGKDRFVTLTTIDSSRFSTALLQRLRSEAARLLQRLDLRRDFPYRFRKSFFASMLVSLALVGLSQVMLNLNVFRNSLNTSLAELSAVAQELSQDPLAAELGHQLMELKSRIENKGLQDAGNEKMINELRRQMRYQLAAGDESGDGQGELLRQAARTLQNLAESRESGKRPRVDSRMAKGGEGGDTGDKGSRRDKRQSGDETTKGNNQGGEESDFQITKQQPGKNEREKSQLGGMEMPRDAAGKNGGKGVGPGRESQEKGPEEKNEKELGGKVPDRFYKSGEEMKERIEGARYVIVELPEGEEGPGAPVRGKGRLNRQGPKVIVPNVPLPARARQSGPSEKQQIPLEYRRMLR